MQTYFDVPTQVIFNKLEEIDHYDGSGPDYELLTYGGIAYHEVIICGCCGGIVEISDFEPSWGESITPVAWVNLDMEIRGESF